MLAPDRRDARARRRLAARGRRRRPRHGGARRDVAGGRRADRRVAPGVLGAIGWVWVRVRGVAERARAVPAAEARRPIPARAWIGSLTDHPPPSSCGRCVSSGAAPAPVWAVGAVVLPACPRWIAGPRGRGLVTDVGGHAGVGDRGPVPWRAAHPPGGSQRPRAVIGGMAGGIVALAPAFPGLETAAHWQPPRLHFRSMEPPAGAAMSVLRSIESKIAGLVEGTFSRAFRSEVRPVEIARKLAREMEEHKVALACRERMSRTNTGCSCPRGPRAIRRLRGRAGDRAGRLPARARPPGAAGAAVAAGDRVRDGRAAGSGRVRDPDPGGAARDGPRRRRPAPTTNPGERWSTAPPAVSPSRSRSGRGRER